MHVSYGVEHVNLDNESRVTLMKFHENEFFMSIFKRNFIHEIHIYVAQTSGIRVLLRNIVTKMLQQHIHIQNTFWHFWVFGRHFSFTRAGYVGFNALLVEKRNFISKVLKNNEIQTANWKALASAYALCKNVVIR